MSFPKYPTYKENEVEWIGSVPAHWETARLKNLLAEVDARADERKFELLGLSKSVGVVRRSELEQGASQADDYGKYKVAMVGQLVMNKMQAWNGVFGLSPVTGVVSPDYSVFRFLRSGVDEFLCALFRTDLMAGVFFTRCRGMGIAFLRLNTPDFLDIKVAIPPIDESRQIAAFLDHETAKIDALIAEQKTLIALLKEKRQAVISHAVTKGLDSSVPMKDSGVEWLGEVPAHWNIVRVKHVARLESGHTPSKQVAEYWENCTIPWVSLNDSKQLAVTDYITDTAVQINEKGLENSSARMLPPGVVVFTRDATIGLAAITTRPMAVSQHLIAWCPGNRITALYLLRVFNAMKEYLDASTFGATIKTIGMDDVKRLVMPVPPIREQDAIASFIDVERSRIGELIDSAEKAALLLRERRGALISSAVIGQIDVRGFAVAEAT